MARTKQQHRQRTVAGKAPRKRLAIREPRRPAEAQSKRKRRARAGTAALRQIRKYQKSWELLITKASFSRLVREIAQSYGPAGVDWRWKADAMEGLQEAAERYIVEKFEDGQICAIHRKRVGIAEKDVQLGIRLSEKQVH